MPVAHQDEADFVVAAAKIAKLCYAYSPDAWRDFLAGLSKYADRGIMTMLQANQRLEYAQGYANARLHLLQTMASCIKEAEKIRK